MKVKALLFTAVIAAAAYAAQDAVTFNRTYKTGEKDTYSLKIMPKMQMGEVEVSMKIVQEIVKVYENGDADQKTTTADMKIMFNGQDMSEQAGGAMGNAQPTTTRINKAGMPVGAPARGGNPMMSGMNNLLAATSTVAGKTFKIGQTVPIEEKDKDGKVKIKGTILLESLTDGVGKLVGDLEVPTEGGSPMKLKFTTWVEAATGKTQKMEANATGLPAQGGMPVDSVSMTMVREK